VPAQLLYTTSLGAALPAAATLRGAAVSGLQAQIDGLIAAQARLTTTPPSLTANLAIAQQIVAGIQAAIAVGVPGVDFQLSAIAAARAALEVQLAALDFGLSAGGVSVYLYTGRASDMGSALGAAIGNGPPGSLPGALSGAVVLAATAPAAKAALGGFCGVSIP